MGMLVKPPCVVRRCPAAAELTLSLLHRRRRRYGFSQVGLDVQAPPHRLLDVWPPAHRARR
jgi:hypothetical protein